jgi:hypothetical protein
LLFPIYDIGVRTIKLRLFLFKDGLFLVGRDCKFELKLFLKFGELELGLITFMTLVSELLLEGLKFFTLVIEEGLSIITV